MVTGKIPNARWLGLALKFKALDLSTGLENLSDYPLNEDLSFHFCHILRPTVVEDKSRKESKKLTRLLLSYKSYWGHRENDKADHEKGLNPAQCCVIRI